MTDRQLLERAAKAANLPHQWNEFWKGMYVLTKDKVSGERWDPDSQWNPLQDNADAFRLMVSMNRYGKQSLADKIAIENLSCYGDYENAMRRAIVFDVVESHEAEQAA